MVVSLCDGDGDDGGDDDDGNDGGGGGGDDQCCGGILSTTQVCHTLTNRYMLGYRFLYRIKRLGSSVCVFFLARTLTCQFLLTRVAMLAPKAICPFVA